MTSPLPYALLPICQEDVTHEYGPDSASRVGIDAGPLVELSIDHSRRYPGSSRKSWIHQPAGH